MSSSLLPNQTKDSYDRSVHLSFSSLFNSRILFENILCVHKATVCPTILTLRSFGNQSNHDFIQSQRAGSNCFEKKQC